MKRGDSTKWQDIALYVNGARRIQQAVAQIAEMFSPCPAIGKKRFMHHSTPRRHPRSTPRRLHHNMLHRHLNITLRRTRLKSNNKGIEKTENRQVSLF